MTKEIRKLWFFTLCSLIRSHALPRYFSPSFLGDGMNRSVPYAGLAYFFSPFWEFKHSIITHYLGPLWESRWANSKNSWFHYFVLVYFDYPRFHCLDSLWEFTQPTITHCLIQINAQVLCIYRQNSKKISQKMEENESCVVLSPSSYTLDN